MVSKWVKNPMHPIYKEVVTTSFTNHLLTSWDIQANTKKTGLSCWSFFAEKIYARLTLFNHIPQCKPPKMNKSSKLLE